jgi:pyruvate formate lyase activating enzyme
VRINKNGHLYCEADENISAVALDPIEKKPLYHFLPATEILSIGGIGCNLSCQYCQNWHISTSTLSLNRSLSAPQLLQLVQQYEVKAVAFTYNEPLIGFEYLLNCCKYLKENGIRTVLVSNGFINPEPLRELLPFVDAINFDLKAFDEKFYNSLCSGSLNPVLESIKESVKQNVWVELTQLIIPGHNDDEKQFSQMLDWIIENMGNQYPLHLSAFRPAFQMTHIPPTSEITLKNLYQEASHKLHFVYLGNISASREQATLCPKCQKILISRSWHHINVKPGFKGKCPGCGNIIPGYWQ